MAASTLARPTSLHCRHRSAAMRTVSTTGCSSCGGVADLHHCALHDVDVTLHRVRDARGRTWRSCVACLAAGEHQPA